MRNSVWWIPGPWDGRLAIVPRPRGADWLEDEVKAWRDAGIDIVVSSLEQSEEAELDLSSEAECVVAHGLEFRSFPIPDRGVPASLEAVAKLTADLLGALRAGKSVAVHCRQSVGRSGLISTAILVAGGEHGAIALDTVACSRGVAVPETNDQRQWVSEFTSSLQRSRDLVSDA